MKMNDRQLRQNVMDELEFEPSIDAANIGVSVENGVVTLTGHVPNFVQKLAAERAAWRVKGVKGIAEEIQVRLPGDRKTNDDEIAQRALNVIAWNTLVPRNAIRVKVQNGYVTLTGEVDWNYQREAAVADIRKLDGVSGVTNDITLKPAIQTVDVKQRITDALVRHAEVEASHVRIRVPDAGIVSLEGEVDNWDERSAVVHAAWSAPGVRVVQDNLRIS
jgi:osmotically-inducible protein OsmY